ncbi:MAG TPA: hypothetical protein VMR98_05905 [Candidatus Polarisedimenticolaceae bacterium]|nr:hypothetical protein [Candidatus Polarisedimenticolaceae bacterium]
MIVYNATESAGETMAKSTKEEMQASMAAWMAWKDEAEKKVKFEFGSPMQAVGRITPDGVVASDSQASGYSMIEADSKELVIEVLRNHPHLQRKGATIDVLEMITMPGMSHTAPM